MPTVHEALLNAPVVRRPNVMTLEELQSAWEECKAYSIKRNYAGAISMDGGVALALIWRFGSFRSFAGISPAEAERVVVIAQTAIRNIGAIQTTNPAVQKIHAHIVNNWG